MTEEKTNKMRSCPFDRIANCETCPLGSEVWDKDISHTCAITMIPYHLSNVSKKLEHIELTLDLISEKGRFQ